MRKGFTTIELLVVIGIMVITVAAVLPMYSNLQVTAQLNETNSQIAQTLRIAKEESMSRLNNANHGVKFFSGSFVLYQGTSYALRDNSYDRTVTLEPVLSITTTLVGDEINFTRASGLPDTTGTTTLTHMVNGTRHVFINSYGTVTEN
jgi:type II secretory pathway pseudopilin PulG